MIELQFDLERLERRVHRLETRLDAALAAHQHTDQCSFDRNGSHNAGHYVCMCGWEDAEQNSLKNAAPQGVTRTMSEPPQGAVAALETSVNHAPVGVAPGLPEEPIRYAPTLIGMHRNAHKEFSGLHPYPNGHWTEYTAYAELRTLYLRAVKERDALLRGEFICKKCGLRKDAEHDEPPTF